MGASPCPDGKTFRVWAPQASGVVLIGPRDDAGDNAHPMLSEPRGYWSAFVEKANISDPCSYGIVTAWESIHPAHSSGALPCPDRTARLRPDLRTGSWLVIDPTDRGDTAADIVWPA